MTDTTPEPETAIEPTRGLRSRHDHTPYPVGDAPHVVIVGAGFGGLSCAKALGSSGLRVTIIDQRNYHLFTPLLYQVATAALSPADITAPVRQVLADQLNIDTVMAAVGGVDAAAKRVLLSDGGFIPYDVLILATGSMYDYFGKDEWAAHAPGVKTIDNARAIRARLLRAFEEAETTSDLERQAELLTTVVVGGGPTGVEMAGTIAELARYTLAGDFRRIDPKSARVILIEAGPTLLSSFPATLQRYALGALKEIGVEVRLNTKVEAIEAGVVTTGAERIVCGNTVWGAGIRAAPAAAWLGLKPDRQGRISVGGDLAVPGFNRIFAIGDLAYLEQRGKPLPALAQVATQQGQHIANQLKGRSFEVIKAGKLKLGPFRYSSRGDTAVIGRSSAVFVVGPLHMKGRLAWMLWGFVHVYLLIGFGHPLSVALQWVWRYLTSERGARLID
jgi:NADH dehydrogenase